MASDARFMDRAEWDELETGLAAVIPSYERVNRVMSLGQVGSWRRAVARHVQQGETVVEVGSGPGQFAATLPDARLVLVDPLFAMQRAARALLAGRGRAAAFAVGAAEALPLSDAVADHVVCAFSFRDFLDKPAALSEMRRVLRPRGRLWILDVRKPARGPMAALMRFHVRHVVPVLGRAFTPRRLRKAWSSDPYRAFARTYEAFGTPETYAAMARDAGFEAVDVQALSLGGAMLLSARRPTAPPTRAGPGTGPRSLSARPEPPAAPRQARHAPR